VPKLWSQTIAAHRREVRDTILDAAAALVSERGLLSVTMSQIAATTGIGRATLYKYFPDVESILLAWHERQITGHLAQLAELRDRAGSPMEQLEAVLAGYAFISYQSHGHDSDVAAFLHRDPHVARAERQLQDMIRDIIHAGTANGELRDDVPADELASYCLHAVRGANSVRSRAAVARLVRVTLTGLRRTR
jgi:AcrR family transcriptional regulator